MTIMLLPGIALSSVRSLSEAADRDTPVLLARNLRELALAARVIAGNVRTFWEQSRSLLATEGMQAPELRKNTALFLECLVTLSEALTRINRLARRMGDPLADVCSNVAEVEARVQSLQAEISGVHELVSRPVGPDFLERARKAAEEDPGVYLTHEEMLAGFQDPDH